MAAQEKWRHSAAEAPAAPEAERSPGRYLLVKRVLDAVISLTALLVLSPVMLAIALLVKRDSPGPAIFTQERMGYDERKRQPRTFRMHKFRSMYHNSDESLHQQFIKDLVGGRVGDREASPDGLVKLTRDPRVTRLGRLLRKTSLDELPQLWDVLMGDMSLVGPRPVPLYEVAEYQPWQRRRLEATPGITCLWQVKGRGLVGVDEMVRMDLEYIETRNLWLDFKILLQTIPVVLTRRGAA